MNRARGAVPLLIGYTALAVLVVLQCRIAGRVPPLLRVNLGYWVAPVLAWAALSTAAGWWAVVEGNRRRTLPERHVVWLVHVFSLAPAMYAVIFAVLLSARTEALFMDALAATLTAIGYLLFVFRASDAKPTPSSSG